MSYTYILLCADGTLYTGWTSNLIARLKAHNSGRGARYTRSRRPVQLAYSERHRTKSAAMKREIEIKRMTRREKLKLVSG